jgi:hypothetical protein
LCLSLKGDLPTQTGTTTCTYSDGDVIYGSGIGHSDELVTLYAKGAGTGYLENYEYDWYPARIIDNTRICKGMSQAAGLE